MTTPNGPDLEERKTGSSAEDLPTVANGACHMSLGRTEARIADADWDALKGLKRTRSPPPRPLKHRRHQQTRR